MLLDRPVHSHVTAENSNIIKAPSHTYPDIFESAKVSLLALLNIHGKELGSIL